MGILVRLFAFVTYIIALFFRALQTGCRREDEAEADCAGSSTTSARVLGGVLRLDHRTGVGCRAGECDPLEREVSDMTRP